MLSESDFTARLEAALALRKEREGREERSGTGHLAKGKKSKKKDGSAGGVPKKKDHKRKPAFAKREENVVTVANDEYENSMEDAMEDTENVNDGTPEHITDTTNNGDIDDDDDDMDEESLPEINPTQSLFDNHTSSTLQSNLSYMTNTYSFFLPDPEYCIDLEGILGYCSEKVRLGRTCLYCQRVFRSWEGCMKHMRDKRHCKILYERGVDQEEFDVFYDFEKANEEFLGKKTKVTDDGDKKESEVVVDDDEAMEEGDEGEWEDVDNYEDESMKDDDLYAAYQEEIASHGFDITPLGELIFPDGRIVGHRGLSRYYKQRFAPDRMERAAVRAARDAAGDRLYGGRVVNLYQLRGEDVGDGSAGGSGEGGGLALATSMGRMAGSIPTGRSGKGILVSGGGKGGFTSLSLYRYRAAVKKQRREDDRGRRLQYRTQYNMNRMDKKANNKMTGVVTSMQPR
jgi:pre-60S factor REI1